RRTADEAVDWSGEPDERLLDALADDPAALAPLYDRHAGLVYGLAMAILRSPEEAQDLVQEVFLTLCDQRNYDAARGSVGAYLTTVTRTRAIDRLRRRTRRAQLLRDWHAATPAVDPPPTALERISTAQCSARVRTALAGLPENERRALEMA